MGVLLGFASWALYWVLVGNAPPLIAAAVAWMLALAVLFTSRDTSARALGIGGIATFSVLAILPLTSGGAQRWVLPLSVAGLLAVLSISAAWGTSVVAAVAKADLGSAVAQSELFAPVVRRLTQIWLGALAVMAVSTAVPAIARSDDAVLRNADSPLVYLCCWVLPFATLAAAAIGSHILADRMTAGFGESVRKTSFVAFVDLEIDQLYYLATEHANREVGPGQEVYNVTIGTKGTALVGDETRVSWPSTYKVRPRRG